MDYQEAIERVLNAAEDWAGEYGFSMPEVATKVFEAIKIVEGKTNE